MWIEKTENCKTQTRPLTNKGTIQFRTLSSKSSKWSMSKWSKRVIGGIKRPLYLTLKWKARTCFLIRIFSNRMFLECEWELDRRRVETNDEAERRDRKRIRKYEVCAWADDWTG